MSDTAKNQGWQAGWEGVRRDRAPTEKRTRLYWLKGWFEGNASRKEYERQRARKVGV